MEQLKPMHLPLELVLNIVACLLPKPNVLLAPSHPITQTLVAFTLVCHETRRVANRYLAQHCVYLSSESRLSSFLLTIPTRPDLSNITTLLLAPFGNTIDDQPIATWIRELLCYTATTLKRLIIDMPLRSLWTEDDHLGVRDILRDGFLRLENLEEFVSVRDECFLTAEPSDRELPFWRCWKKLRRLAVYNPFADLRYWRTIALMPMLETVVLTRADSLEQSNIKDEYFKYCDRPLKLLLFDVEENQVRFSRLRRERWDEIDPKKKMTIITYNVPMFMDDDRAEICQDYVRIGAEYGTLWDWEGEVIQHPIRNVQLVSSGA